MTAGLTPEGLTIETTDTLLAAVQPAIRAGVSAGLSLSSTSVMGQLTDLFMDSLGEAWQGIQAVDTQFDPSSAEGIAADTVAALSGVYRQLAAPTLVSENCTFSGAFSAPAGTMFVTVAGDATRRFTNSFDVVVSGAGTSAIQFECTVTGPVSAPSGTVTALSNPQPGWTTATNPADGTLGRDRETDSALLLRREQELAQGGSATPSAQQTAIGNVAGVSSVNILVNDLDSTDANGVPPHSTEAVVIGGVDLDVATAIYNNSAGGIHTNGTTTVNVTDENGNVWPIGLTRPAATNMYFIFNIKIDSTYGTDTNLKNFITSWANGGTFNGVDVPTYFSPGKTVVGSRVGAQLFSLQGVVDVVSVLLGTVPSPATSTEVGIDVRHYAALDPTRIVVNHV